MDFRIYGSTAIYHWFSDFPRKPNDIDVISFNKKNELFDSVNFPDDIKQQIFETNTDKVFLDPNVLITLKLSHLQWNINFKKHLHDFHFLKEKKAIVNEDLYVVLYKYWKNYHKDRRSNLNQSLDKFFNDAVKRNIPHEKLHELVAFYDRPLHESIRKDLSKAYVDKDLYFSLSYEDQVKAALEEIIVISIERFNLTKNSSNVEIMLAFDKSYVSLCTRIASGWWVRFLLENYKEIFPPKKYLEKYKSILIKM